MKNWILMKVVQNKNRLKNTFQSKDNQELSHYFILFGMDIFTLILFLFTFHNGFFSNRDSIFLL